MEKWKRESPGDQYDRFQRAPLLTAYPVAGGLILELESAGRIPYVDSGVTAARSPRAQNVGSDRTRPDAVAARIVFLRVLTPVARPPGGPIRSELAAQLRAETALPPEWHHRAAIQR
jgi:hypothetical protein